MRVPVIALVVVIACGIARGSDEVADDSRFREAALLATTDPAGALAAFEALGARRPITRWTDNAWSEAARLAERAGDYARAREALVQVIEVGTDEVLVRRARMTLERLTTNTGGGAWDAIAKRHEVLVSAIFGGSDPHAALAELAALVREYPAYPRATAARVAIARGWEMEGEIDAALSWLREAARSAGDTEPGQRTRIELARMTTRAGELDAARAELTALASIATTDRAARDEAVRDLDRAETRALIRRAVTALLAVLAFAAMVVLRRDVGTWSVVARRVIRPPVEVVFVAPLAALFAGIGATGNPLAARSIAVIAVAGVGVTWLSGVLIDSARARGRLGARRLVIHILVVVLAVAAASYLAVERKVIDLIAETYRGGHAH